MYCNKCGAQLPDDAKYCNVCGNMVQRQSAPEEKTYVFQGTVTPEEQMSTRSKMVAGLLGIFVGAFGVHNFYLGKIGRGVAQIALTLCSCGIGSIWGFIEGILILCDRIDTDADGKKLAP